MPRCFDVLDRLRLAGRLVDREHDNAVFAALEDLLPLIILGLLGPVRAIDKAAVRVDVHRARRLPGADVVRFGQRARDKGRIRREPAVLHREHHHLVLRLDRDINPRLGRVKIEVPRPEFLAAVRRDRDFVAQDAVLVVEDLQRAGVFRLGRGALVAARHQDRKPVVGRHAHLMGVDAGIDRTGLRHLLARGEILVDAVDPHRTRVVERDQNIFGRNVGAHMDRAHRQADRLAVFFQGAGRRVDREGGDVMLGADSAVPGTVLLLAT